MHYKRFFLTLSYGVAWTPINLQNVIVAVTERLVEFACLPQTMGPGQIGQHTTGDITRGVIAWEGRYRAVLKGKKPVTSPNVGKRRPASVRAGKLLTGDS